MPNQVVSGYLLFHPADSLDQPHLPNDASNICTYKLYSHIVVLALVTKVVGHNIPEMNGGHFESYCTSKEGRGD